MSDLENKLKDLAHIINTMIQQNKETKDKNRN